METELKFALSPDARRTLERHAAFHDPATGEVTTHTDHTIYFDTSNFALHKAGFSLRIRHRLDERKYVQTVKAAAAGSGLRRQEWEWPVAGEGLDLEHLDEVPGLLAVLNGGRADLQPVFCTKVRRCEKMLRPGGGLVELALDDGTIVASEQSEPLSELELELKAGSEQALFLLGLDLAQAAPLSLQVESKAERGYRLQNGNGPKAHEPDGVALETGATATECFARLADAVLEHLLANQPAALRGEEAEGVHQMRVAVRRLRSLLALFAPLLESGTRCRFEDELRRLGDCLGVARDWDVFVEETLPQAASDGVGLGWIESLHAAAQTKRHAAHQAAKKAIGAPSFARFVLAFRAWSRRDAAALAPRAAERRISAVAARLLGRLERRVARRLDCVDGRDPASLHAVRKSAKKLRYGIEYLDAPFGREARRYAKRCNALQKKLGALNDLETASRRVMELLGDDRLDLAPAVGALSNWSEARRPKLLRKALKACAAFARRDPFW